MAKLWRTKVQKRTACSVALFLIAGTLSSCLGWSAQLSTIDGSSLSGISCPGASECFAVGSTTQGSALAKQTVNGGAQWASDTTGVSGFALTAISCSDSEDCVAVGAGHPERSRQTTGRSAVMHHGACQTKLQLL